MNARTIFAAAVVAISTTAVAQTTRLVPSQYPTIQAAINACINGDTVLVAPGSHSGSISFLGKAITVTSSGGALNTTIAGTSGVVVVTFATNESAASVLNGFTVTGGAGILIQNTSPTVTNCRVINNLRNGKGGGVLCTTTGTGTASPTFTGCTISNNTTINGPGGGLAFDGLSTSTSFPTLWDPLESTCRHASLSIL